MQHNSTNTKPILFMRLTYLILSISSRPYFYYRQTLYSGTYDSNLQKVAYCLLHYNSHLGLQNQILLLRCLSVYEEKLISFYSSSDSPNLGLYFSSLSSPISFIICLNDGYQYSPFSVHTIRINLLASSMFLLQPTP